MINLDDNFISIVAYLHKNDSDVMTFLQTIEEVLKSNFRKYEYIFVDDGANENVINQIRNFKKRNNSIIRIIKMGFAQGLEASMNAGIDLAIGDFVYEFDSVLIDYPGKILMDVYHKALEGYDIVATVPQGLKCRISTKVFYRIYNLFRKSNEKLSIERFRIVSRRAINRAESYSDVIPYRKAVYSSIGLNKTNIIYISNSKNNGYRFVDSGKIGTAIDAIVLFTDLAYKASIVLASVLLLIAIIAVIFYGLYKNSVFWIPYAIIPAFCSCIILFFFAITFKYLEVLLKLVFKKEKYLISDIEKCD